ncbi:MAG TPA: lysylphosphatidylglycerol synthase domain-containing protein, partial [Flavobacterium sp.]|nr:lysylphosphatidylglycerol synthase domain-containing protein [Flavobacterium sp.]
MSDQKPSSWNRKRIIRQGVTLAFIGLTFFVIYKEGQHYISQVPQLFREADPLHVLGLFLLQCLTFILNAIVCILLLRFLNIKARFRDTLIVAAGNKLGNKLLPVVGGIAAGYYTYRKVLKISQGQAVFLMTAWTSLLLANYALIIFASSLFLPREVLRAWPLLIPVISIAFFGSVILGYLLLRDHGRNFFSISNRIYHYGNKFWHLFFSRDIIERTSFEKITAEVKEGFVLMAG